MHAPRHLLGGILRAAECLLLATTTLAGAAQSRPPNILFILADDQSFKTLSCYEGAPPWVKTPNIDRLASRGVRFERSYLGAWCMSARASLLTGRMQHAIQSLTLTGSYPESSYDPREAPFFPAELRKRGYQTAQIGKWHVGSDTGFGRDWDHQIVWNRPGRPDNAGNYYHKQIVTVNGTDRAADGYATDNYTQWALDYLAERQRDRDQPWFLWLCYGTPHHPTTPAERHRGRLAGQRAPVPADITGPWPDKPQYLERKQAWMLAPDGQPAKARKVRAADNTVASLQEGQRYDAWIQQVNECMASLDEGVGRIVAALEASGQLENTLIVFSADQGFGLGEHGFNDKFAPYDATLASPLIIAWPGVTPAGKVCRHPVNSPDLTVLIARAAGVSLPWRTHGRDVRSLLTNPETATWSSPLLLTHTGRSFGAETDVIPTDARLTAGGGVPWYALLRDGKYKYVRYLLAGETEELYDLEADPEELRNLAPRAEYRARLADLRGKTIAELRRTEAKFVDRLPPAKTGGPAPRTDAPAPPTSDEPNLTWHDVTTWGAEGRAFVDATRHRWFDRLPASAQGKVTSAVWGHSRDSAGMLVRFRTDATTIWANYTLLKERLTSSNKTAVASSGLDLYTRDPAGNWRWVGVTRPDEKVVRQRIIEGLVPGVREYAVYLPLYNGVEALSVGVPPSAKFEPLPPRTAKPIVYYGTSITHGASASRPGMTHSAILGRRLDLPFVNLGFSGNGRMDAAVGGFMTQIDAAVYVIDCLPNMDAKLVRDRCQPLVRQLRAARPHVPIVLVEDRRNANAWLLPARNDHHTANHAALRSAFEALRADGITGLHYIAGDGLIGADGEGTTDGSHPSDLGFMRQADVFEPVLRAALDRR